MPGYLTIAELLTYAPDATIETGKEQSFIDRASVLIDEYLHRSIAVTTYTERMSLTSGGSHLTYLPVVSLTSVKARHDIRNDPQASFLAQPTWDDIDITTVDLLLDTGIFYILQTVLSISSILSSAIGNYTEAEVVYTAGYATVPEAVKQACGQLITNMSMRPNPMAVAEQLPNGLRTSYGSTSLITPEIAELLGSYVAWSFR